MSKNEEILEKLGGSNDHPYTIGQNYFFRCLNYHYTGKLLRVFEQELVILDAAWIPESDQWHKCVANGALKECEPYPDGMIVIIPRPGTSSNPISWPLPRSVK